MSRRRRRNPVAHSARSASAGAGAHDIATTDTEPAPPLFTRLEAMVNLAMRTVVPVIGVLFLGYDAKRLAALYFVDTWLCFASLFGLLMYQYLPIGRGEKLRWIDTVNGYAGFWLAGLFAASCVMFAAGFPMIFVLSWADVRAMANDQNFLLTLGGHVASSTVAFVMQTLRTRIDEGIKLRLRHRIEFAFLRWIAVYMVVMAATLLGASLGTSVGQTLAVVLVLSYAALTVVAELYPEEIRRALTRSRSHERVRAAAAATPARTPRRRA